MHELVSDINHEFSTITHSFDVLLQLWKGCGEQTLLVLIDAAEGKNLFNTVGLEAIMLDKHISSFYTTYPKLHASGEVFKV